MIFLLQKSESLKDAVYGAAIGDALGVPYEFKKRDTFECQGMIGYGTHNQPVGTWSDDTALMLATCDSIRTCKSIDVGDMLERFRAWAKQGKYTPDGVVFDIGGTTSYGIALGKGQDDFYSNGNGSLMRIAPLAFCGATDDEICEVSAITHAHEISLNTCMKFVHILREADRNSEALRERLVAEYGTKSRSDINSGGFVLNTYSAALWCFATTSTYKDCVLRAVNLGSDTDTTACVAGALAGTVYGMDSIPREWIQALRGKDIIEQVLF